MRSILPEGWPRPKGYANAIAARGEIIFVAGQIGWTPEGKFEATDLPGQFRQCLQNTTSILQEAGATPSNIARMTWYLTDKKSYLDSLGEIGRIYRDIIGKHYPAMAVVEVTSLMEDQALIEIETTAVVES